MYTIWVLALSLGVVSADVSLGYKYKVPETSYGVPSHQISSNKYNTGLSGGSTGSVLNFGSGSTVPGFSAGSDSSSHADIAFSSGSPLNFNAQPAPTSGYNFNAVASGTGNQGEFQGFGQNAQSGSYYQTGSSSIVGSQPSQLGGGGYYNQYQTGNDYQSSAGQKYQDYYSQIVHQPPQVYKHFYVHAAPEELEIPKSRQPIVLPPPQKHYKIIFIKAPSQAAPAPQIIPVQQQNDEKTIVYVLVKKPEDVQNIVLPKIEPKPPTKPEVFFIKYNGKQGSQSVINNIVNDYNKGGSAGTSFSNVATSGYFEGAKGSELSGGSAIVSGASSSSEIGSSSGQSEAGISDGAYAFSSTGSSGNAFGAASEVENQDSSSFSNHHPPTPAVSVSTDDSEPPSSGLNLDKIFGPPKVFDISSSTASSESVPDFVKSAISTSQGVPHETYGTPDFKNLNYDI